MMIILFSTRCFGKSSGTDHRVINKYIFSCAAIVVAFSIKLFSSVFGTVPAHSCHKIILAPARAACCVFSRRLFSMSLLYLLMPFASVHLQVFRSAVISLACTIEAVRTDRVGEDRLIRTVPNKNIAVAIETNVIAFFLNFFHSKFWAHVQLTTEANQVIKNEIPQMPVMDANCINGRSAAWV